MHFTITSDQIVEFCAFITVVWGAIKIIKEVKKPNDDMKNKIIDHQRMLDNDYKKLTELEENNKRLLQCMLVIMNHSITGNGIDKMKEVRDELQEYLINK